MKVSRSVFLTLCLAVVPCLQGASAEPAAPGAFPAAANLPGHDATLADRAFLADTVLEEMLGQALGEQAGRRPGGARFALHARQMRSVHGELAERWRAEAEKREVRTPDALDAERFAFLLRLDKTRDADYERVFARTALQLHMLAVDRLETQARSGSDPALRRAAEKAIPEAMVLVRASQALWNELAPIGM